MQHTTINVTHTIDITHTIAEIHVHIHLLIASNNNKILATKRESHRFEELWITSFLFLYM
jgi:hypothetical protein